METILTFMDETTMEDYKGMIDSRDTRLKMYIISSHVDKPLEEDPPKSAYDCPIQAGAALTDRRICALNDHDGFPESISARNKRYSETTAMWWIGNHIDTPYVGIEHYRRRFKLTDKEISDYMDEGIDIITTYPILMSWSVEDNYRHEWWSTDWDLFMEILKEYAPQDLALANTCYSSNVIYCYNINVFRGELYRAFCEWAFPMLDAFYRRSPEKTDILQHRDVGYIAERLSYLFVMKMREEGKKIAEAEVICLQSSDWSPEKECDTGNFEEVWNACDRLYQKNRITECNKVMAAALRRGGDQNERLRALSEVLSTGVLERMELPQSMYEYLPFPLRSDLKTLLETYNGFAKVLRLWRERNDEESRKLLADYIAVTRFSKVVAHRILQEIQKSMT